MYPNSPKWLLCLSSALLICLGTLAQAQGFKIPKHESYALTNGLKVFLMPQNEVPLLHISVSLQAGSAVDGNSFGLASLVSDALTLGTKAQTKAKIEELFDFHGAEVEATVNQDFSAIDLSFASQDAERLLPIFADLLINPVFPEKELIKLRERTISDLIKAKESPNKVADQFFNRVLFTNHPYGHPVQGSPRSIGKIQRTDLIKFHSTWYRPQLAAVSLVGNLDINTMKGLIEKNFGHWASGEMQAKPIIPKQNSASIAHKGQVFLVNKADAQETTFRIGGIGVARNDKNWVPLQVVNTILGGRFTSLLNEELRVKTGLTYGARSRFDAFKDTGTFAMASFTATENTEKTLALALKTYERFVKDGVDQVTLDSAKAYVKGQFPPRYETLEALSNLLLQLWEYNLTDASIDNFEAEVDRLTLAQANALIAEQFPTQNLTFLLIGQTSKIQDIAKQYGKLTKADIAAVQEGQL